MAQHSEEHVDHSRCSNWAVSCWTTSPKETCWWKPLWSPSDVPPSTAIPSHFFLFCFHLFILFTFFFSFIISFFLHLFHPSFLLRFFYILPSIFSILFPPVSYILHLFITPFSCLHSFFLFLTFLPYIVKTYNGSYKKQP